MNDYSVFSSTDFDPNDYANAILAGDPYPPPSESNPKSSSKLTATKLVAPEPSAKEDISIAISKLSFGIEDVSKQIKALVSSQHEDLLSQAAGATDLAGSLTSVRAELAGLDSSVEKLRLKIRIPYQNLQTDVSRLQKFQQAADVLRRTSRFVVLVRRLQGQMADIDSAEPPLKTIVHAPSIAESIHALVHDGEDDKERTIAKAALSIAELVSLLDTPVEQLRDSGTKPQADDAGTNVPLRSVTAVSERVPFIEEARTRVTTEMENMVFTGLETLNQSFLASSLQTAYNLRVLPDLVQSLVVDLSQAVEERIRSAFDLSKISKDAVSRDSQSSPAQSPALYKSRVRTEPTNVTAPQWTAALWSRLENLIEEMADCCIKVYTLEKVLKMKRDTVSQTVFLDEAMKLLENTPSATFWSSLGRSLEKCSRDSARSSTFLQQTLSTGYPKLLRLFHEFFSKISVHTDTVYSHSHQSPETILILRAISNFESVYLSRSSTKLNEAVGQAFTGGSRAPPGANEGISISRTIANELDSARFDPLLIRSVAKNATTTIDMVLSRVDALAVRDRSSVTFMGPSATPQQILNASLATCVHQCWIRVSALSAEHADAVTKVLSPSVENLRSAYIKLVDPVLTAIRRELGAIIARLHRIDFGKAADAIGMGGPSFYMKELVEKLSFIKSEILSLYDVGDEGRTWVLSIVKFVIRTFVLHISIARPLGENGKLQLTSDMTELEFALSAFMVESGQNNKRGVNLEVVGDDYHVLRAMRHLLFLENSQLASSQYTVEIPPLIVLHHILVRSPIPLPHSIHGWQEAEYVRWVDEHSEEEAWTLVDGALSHWEKITESEGSESPDALQYANLARTVLKNISAAL